MPIYEYHCADCDEKFTLLIRNLSDVEKTDKVCPECGGRNVTKLISRVAVLSGAAESPASAHNTNSPAELVRTMRDASQRLGSDMGDEFHEVAHRLEKGESSKNIERSLRKPVGQVME